MATTAIQFVYSTNDHDQSWGTDVRAFDSSAGASNITSICTFTSTSPAVVTVDPFTNRSTTGDAGTNFGWAINEDTPEPAMDSETGARRAVPAGVWTFQGTTNLSAPALLASYTVVIQARVYRVAAGGGTRTLLFTANSDTLNSAVTAQTNVAWSASSSSQPMYTLEVGETIHVAFNITSAATSSIIGGTTNTTVSFNIGSGHSAFINVPSPGIRTVYEQAPTGAIAPGPSTVTRAPTRLLGSSVGPTGEIVRHPRRHLDGQATPSGQVLRTPAVYFAGTISSSAGLTRTPTKRFTATISPGPSTMGRIPTKRLESTVTPISALVRSTLRHLAGLITPSGVALKRPSIYMAGTVAPGPHVIQRKPVKLLVATITSTATVQGLITKNFRSDLSPAGGLVRFPRRHLTGTVTPTAAVARRPKKFMTGVIGPEGGGGVTIRPIVLLVDD